jgi:hypothetical protein
MRKAYKILVGNPKWKTPFERSRTTWEDNIKMDINENRV